MDDPSHELLTRWRDGDQRAAEEMFHRYAPRLLALARSRLSAWLARRVDPEDVVQSAYKSFFAGAREGRYELTQGCDLWQLLAAITSNKLRRRAEYHAAARRALLREDRLGEEPAATLPEPLQLAEAADTLEWLQIGLCPVERRILTLRLEGYAIEEIAQEVGRCERTVRRSLDRVKQRLRQE